MRVRFRGTTKSSDDKIFLSPHFPSKGEFLKAYTTVTCAPYTIEDLYSPAMTCASALIFEEGEGIWYDISMLIESEEDQTFTTAVMATTKAGFKQKTDIEVIVDNFDQGFVSTAH
jgi:hypothetical protein